MLLSRAPAEGKHPPPRTPMLHTPAEGFSAFQMFGTDCTLFFLLIIILAVVLYSLSVFLCARREKDVQLGSKSNGRSAAFGRVAHIGVIMDGNRRYGKNHSLSTEPLSKQIQEEISSLVSQTLFSHQLQLCSRFLNLIRHSVLDGHRQGGEKLIDMIVHAKTLGVKMLTTYAFSTDNWMRPKYEVDALMMLFFIYFERMRKVCQSEGIFVRFVVTEGDRLPEPIMSLMLGIEEETRQISPRHIVVNVCVSYSGQQEIANAANRISASGNSVTVDALEREMLRSLTQHNHEMEDAMLFDTVSRAPELILRTSGEQRISNFLLFESAYSELFFVQKTWPELSSADLEKVILDFSHRDRRLGK